jgi:hypothetical protein
MEKGIKMKSLIVTIELCLQEGVSIDYDVRGNIHAII